MTLPDSLEEAIAQAQGSVQAALGAGYTRVSVDLLFPDLKVMPIAQQFVTAWLNELPPEAHPGVKVFFTDSGTAAWAKRDWAGLECRFSSVDVAGTRQTTTVEEQIEETDRLYIFVAPTAVEVGPVEQICNAAGDRPVILVNSCLEDVATIGIGYAGRVLRERFLSTLEPCYYLKPLDDTIALTRMYPTPWQVWLEQTGVWTAIAEERTRPDSEKMDEILAKAMGSDQKKTGGFFKELQQFISALGR